MYGSCPKCETQIDAADTTECANCGSRVEPYSHAVGSVIGGFRLEKRLGVGAMGEVFLATQLSMDRPVALKILLPSVLKDEDAVKRFMLEVRTLAKLEHRNIVKAFEAGQDQGCHYLAMTYVDGVNLDERVATEGPLEEAEALKIALKVALALEHAWDIHSMLHRDIKPANIMVENGGDVKLMDMGISKNTEDSSGLTMSGTLLGTPYYMSPEQARGQDDLDQRSDIASLGATLYFLLTGSEPYQGENVLAVLLSVAGETCPHPHEHNPDLSEGCCQLLEYMMAKDRDMRYETWNELAKDIRRVLAGKSPRKAGVSPKRLTTSRKRRTTNARLTESVLPEIEAPPKKRSTAFAIAMAAIVLLVVAGAVGLLIISTPKKSKKKDLAAKKNPLPKPPPKSENKTQKPLVKPPIKPKPNPNKLKHKRITMLLAEARRFQKQNPDAFNEAESKYIKLAAMAVGTPLLKEVTEDTRKLKARKAAAITTLVDGLKEKAAPLQKAGKTEEAMAVLTDYSGRLARLSYVARNAAASAIQIAKQQEAKRAAELVVTQKARLKDLYDEVALALLHRQDSILVERIKEAKADPVTASCKDQTEAIWALAMSLQKRNPIIAKSFEKGVSKPFFVEFKQGKKEILVREVDGAKVLAWTVQRKHGGLFKTKIEFTADDLSAKERYKRLGKGEGPVFDLMRGLVIAEPKYKKSAERYFKRAGGEMGAALIRQFPSLAKDAKPTSARTCMDSLMKLSRLPRKATNPEVLVTLLPKMKYTDSQIAAIRTEATLLVRKYPRSAVVQNNARLISALTKVETFKPKVEPPPVVEPVAKQPVDLLKKINPDRDGIAGIWRMHEEKLFGGGKDGFMLRLPVDDIPSEYELEINCNWVEGMGEAVLGLVKGNRQFQFKINAYVAEGTYTGLSPIDGQVLKSKANPTGVKGPLIKKGVPYRLRAVVKKDSVKIKLNGEVITKFTGDDSRLGKAITPEKKGRLAIGGWKSMNAFSKIILYPQGDAGVPGTHTPATVCWLMADDMDIYHNGKPLREYSPSFRTRPDEARKTAPYSAKIKLCAGDVFTVGGRRGGSYGGTVVVTNEDGKMIWCSNTKDWFVYKPADMEKWYLPSVARKSIKKPVRVAKSFGHQLQMKAKYNNIPQPIWGHPEKQFVFMYGVYKGPAKKINPDSFLKPIGPKTTPKPDSSFLKPIGPTNDSSSLNP